MSADELSGICAHVDPTLRKILPSAPTTNTVVLLNIDTSYKSGSGPGRLTSVQTRKLLAELEVNTNPAAPTA